MATLHFVISLLMYHLTVQNQQVYVQKEEKVFNKGDNYEIVYPIKVDSNGEFLSHDLHHVHRFVNRRLNKRSLADTKVHYRISIANEDFHVHLQPNQRLLAPGMVVERRSANLGNTTMHLQAKSNAICHFHGSIRREAALTVALTTCNGLRGLIRTRKGDFFIEPVKNHNLSKDLPHPHLVYKRLSSSQTEEYCNLKSNFKLDVRQGQRLRMQESNFTAHQRRRRSISSEKNVETLVVADKLMMDYYSNEDIEAYILTVMNMVSALFRDASIGNIINVVLVRILLLEDEANEDGLNINHHAEETLKSFCRWQKYINPKDEDHPNHHDVAILLTRYNICSRINEPCSTLGLAEIAGMCQPHRSCNVNEDTGLAVAYTIAHEMGHNFGMAHDGPHNGCQAPFGVLQHIMSPHLNSDSTPLVWSNCSRRQITTFLDRDWGRCLDDEPSQHDFNFPELPPGTMYDTDHQCRLQYGSEASYCHGIEDVCLTLWCRLGNKCVTRLEPAATGTQCGNNKWCFKGHCTMMGERPEVIDGNWGEWSAWTECSRTCGAGVKSAIRHCNNPLPTNGGRYCVGERKKYKICNIEPCHPSEPTFREVQCSRYNNVAYKGKYFEWIPTSTLENSCQLHCKPVDKFFSVMLLDSVTDGTSCNPRTRDMCINGKCRNVSCDWKIDSSSKEDRCGICHGDGTRCQTNKGEFSQENGIGYVWVVDIPVGARNIHVEEVDDANNYIAIRAKSGEYYLNGNWFIQWSGRFPIPGSSISYHREGERETVYIAGPVKETLQVMLLFQTKNPGLVYDYVTPLLNHTRTPEFYWEYTIWSICTATCGGGIQTSSAQCMEKEAGVIEDVHCKALPRPKSITRSCNKNMCPSRWWVGPWQHCSKTCGLLGTRRRAVFCVRSVDVDVEQIRLNESNCNFETKPKDIDSCHHKIPCPNEDKKTGNWSNCTVVCDPKKALLDEVTCKSGTTCLGDRKNNVYPDCNITCTSNLHHSQQNFSADDSASITPEQFTSSIYIDAEDGAYRNNSTRSNLIPKDYNKFKRKHIKHSSVVLKSEETQLNQLDYKDDRPRGFIADQIDHEDSKVIAVENKTTHKDHNALNSQLTYEKVVNFVDYKLPPQETTKSKPDGLRNKLNFKTANGNEQQFTWKVGDWNDCSKPCNGGHRARKLICYDVLSNTIVDANHCPLHERPLYMETCNLQPCKEWDTSEWSTCSETCGKGFRTRMVKCPDGYTCDTDDKPVNRSSCFLKACVEWVAGAWSQCHATCGDGYQFRHITCVDHTTQKISVGCDETTLKPAHQQRCNVEECPQTALLRSCVNKLDNDVCDSLNHMCSTWYFKTKCCYTCKKYNNQKT